MANLISAYKENQILKHIFSVDELVKFELFFNWLLSNGFNNNETNKVNFNKNKIIITYKKYEIFEVTFKKTKEIEISKVVNSNESTNLIQDTKRFFDKYWIDNIKVKRFSIDEIEKIEDILVDIKSVFFDDVILDFKINSLMLKDFRCFENKKIVFNNKSTIFIGNNASGKTSILDAAAVAIGGFLSGVNELKAADKKFLEKADIRYIKKFKDNTFNTNYAKSGVRIECNTKFINKDIEWARALTSIQSSTTTGEANILTNIVHQIVDDIRDEDSLRNITLPVFSYHGIERLGKLTKDMKVLKQTENISRFLGYDKCLKAQSNIKLFNAWYRKMKYYANEMDITIPVLDAVTNAIETSLKLLLANDDIENIDTIKFLEGEIHLKYIDGHFMPITDLSDGYKDFIGIIQDISFRMAILNPHLNERILETPGIILIDEIDLYLHPSWQQKVFKIFKKIFPNVQFIATTHSPIILSVSENGEAFELIRELDIESKKVYTTVNEIGNPREWFFEDIIEQCFHIHQDIDSFKSDSELTLDEKLIKFSDMVKEYLNNSNWKLKEDIEDLFKLMIPSIPENSPKREAIERLRRLVN